MPTVFIFHGLGGNPEENWFPWLKTELEKKGTNVIVPAFPHPQRPLLDEWFHEFEKHAPLVDASTIFVGHSLGGAFALRLLERTNHPIKATYLVASVSGVVNNDVDPLVTTFNTSPYDWKKIKENGGEMHVIHSNNDPYIALEKAENLARNLCVKVELTKGAGHFNEPSGYVTFPVLRDLIIANRC